ncbi:uncharacterized protein LOC132593062 [Zootoca vivipara]|uniref:uncharacterized protein LOC132593062 n=1 Tax=Zootoca vivipara TaxID=8524 RepID=UPI00293B9918|nr:uncharacterized protein LOC132593062 [Zootoca vivipara]
MESGNKVAVDAQPAKDVEPGKMPAQGDTASNAKGQPAHKPRAPRKKGATPKPMAQFFSKLKSLVLSYEDCMSDPSSEASRSPSPEVIPDTQREDQPGTSASLFHDPRSGMPDRSPVAALISVASVARGQTVQAPLHDSSLPQSSLSLPQGQRHRVQHPEADISSGGEEAQPHARKSQQPGGKRRAKTKHIQESNTSSDGEDEQRQARKKHQSRRTGRPAERGRSGGKHVQHSYTSSEGDEDHRDQEPAVPDKQEWKRCHKKKHVCRKSRSRSSESDGLLPVIGTSSSAVARTLPGPPLEPWKRNVIKGVLASVAPSTLCSYNKVWCNFMDYRCNVLALAHNIPPTTDHVLQYLEHQYTLGRAAKTLKIHSAAITFFSKFLFSLDPCADFIVHRAIDGWGRLEPKKAEGWRPITYDLLFLVRKKLRSICWSRYEARLFSAAYAISFFGALRVGEIVVEKHSDDSYRGLLLKDIQLSSAELLVHIRSSKTDQCGKGAWLKLAASRSLGPCPVKDTRRYLCLRPPGSGPLFIHEDGSRLMRHQFTRVLRMAIDACGFPAKEYAAHSFLG